MQLYVKVVDKQSGRNSALTWLHACLKSDGIPYQQCGGQGIELAHEPTAEHDTCFAVQFIDIMYLSNKSISQVAY